MVRACTMRCSPSAVRGPVLAPPCIRQRPFAIAWPLQTEPDRVRAPHLGQACARAKLLIQPAARMGFCPDLVVIPLQFRLLADERPPSCLLACGSGWRRI